MIKVKNIEVFNFEGALRGMRNPLESWNQSDSRWEDDLLIELPTFKVGQRDMTLALKLIKAGTDHSKFMRQIFVSMDITAPLYWWKEMDQYRVGCTTNSTSTMHKLGTRELTKRDFSWDKMTKERLDTLNHINTLAKKWRESNKENKEIWREMIQDLPDSFLQMRTWTANYQVLRNIYYARKNHKLQEWRDFCWEIKKLPFSKLIIEG